MAMSFNPLSQATAISATLFCLKSSILPGLQTCLRR
jgi:hypothetical protein